MEFTKRLIFDSIHMELTEKLNLRDGELVYYLQQTV